MPQQFLYRPDVVIRLQQVCGKRMAKGVDINRFRYANQAYGGFDGLLEAVYGYDAV